MLQVDPQLYDWDSDSEDGELLDVHTAASTYVGIGGNAPCHNERVDVCMNPKDLPEHLQHLMDWLAEHFSLRERSRRACCDYLWLQRCVQ